MKKLKLIAALVITIGTLASSATTAFAVDPPSVISHQGRITVGGVNFNGTGFFKFALVDTGAATTYWNNDLSQGTMTEPLDGNAVSVTVGNGHYAVGLGDTALTNMGALDPDIFANNSDVNLRIWFSQTGAAASFEQLTPDIVMNSVGFSLNARKAQMVPNGSITAAHISSTYYNQMNSAALGDPGLNSTDLANGNLTLTVTFATPFAAPPTVDVEAGPSAIVNFSSLTGTGFTAAISGVEFAKEVLATEAVGYMACATVNGNPAVAYYNFAADEIRYAYSNSPTGAAGTWADRLIAADVFISGPYRPVALAVIDGHPAICWHELDNGDPTQSRIRYARAFSDPAGITGNWSFSTVHTGTDLSGTAAASVSLAEINGAPAVLYPDYDAVDTVDLVFHYSTDADGIPSSTWTGNSLVLSSTVVVTNPPTSSTNFDGRFVSLQKVNGNPAFAYNITTGSDLGYAWSSTVQGGLIGDWSFVTVDTAVPTTPYPSLAVVNGVPAIAYSGGFAVDYSYAYGSDAQGSGAWNLVNFGVTPSGSAGQNPSLAVVGGKPAIALHDPNPTGGDVLLYAYSDDVQGTMGSWSSLVADSDTETGRYACLVDAGGLPGIAYRYFFDDPMGPPDDFELRFGTLPLPVMWTASGGDQLPIDVKTASIAETVADGAVTTASIANASITAAKLAPGAFSSALIETNSITSLHLATDSVRSPEIADGQVMTVDLADFSVTNSKLGFSSVTTNQILDASVFGIDIAADTITAGNLAASSVDSSEIATNAVGSSELATNAVDTDAIQLGAVALNRIASAGGSNGQVITLSAGVPAWVTPAAGVADHGALTGLSDDDHPQYALVNGTRPFTGAINAGDPSSPVSTSYHYFSSTTPGPTSGAITNGNDILVNGAAEVNGNIYADSGIFIGTDNSADDDFLYFDSGTTEWLVWDDNPGEFVFTDDLRITGTLDVDAEIIRGNTGTVAGGQRALDLRSDGSLSFMIDEDNNSGSNDQFEWFEDGGVLGANKLMELQADGDLRIRGTLSESVAFDIAESFYMAEQLVPGELVRVDPERPIGVLRSDGQPDSVVVGIVSKKPGFLLGGAGFGLLDLDVWGREIKERYLREEAALQAEILAIEPALDANGELLRQRVMELFFERHFAKVALAGRVPVKVDARFGVIRPGDRLAASPVPGVAMKAQERGATIGVALEGLDRGEGEVLTFVQHGWSDETAASTQELKSLIEDKEKRISDLEARLDRLEQARAVPYREVEYRVKDEQFEVRERPGRFEKRVYPEEDVE